MTGEAFTLSIATSLTAVDAGAWDACANPFAPGRGLEAARASPEVDPDNPFVTHAFLSALEESGSAVAKTGWSPAHLLVEKQGTLLAAAPCWLKTHSRGEYVFDWGWAEAYERAGGRYYPKLQVCVPFTPAEGPRLLVKPGPDAAAARDRLIGGFDLLMERTGASSTHITFLPEADWEDLGRRGWLRRQDQQFHWRNEGYATYDDFLAALASRKRKALKRERREALAAGIEIVALTGRDLTEAVWDVFHAFYLDTGSRKWGSPYLTRRFFSLIGERMADRIVLFIAKRAGRPIAGAINFLGAETIYGRHWGAIEHHPFLHFELCYHRAIDFAIEKGLKRVEAGAQGEHKLARGYRPTLTHSAHRIADPGLAKAVAAFLVRERRQVEAIVEEYDAAAPFRHDD